jgi:flagellar biosynthesis regulator FlbT
MLVNCVQSNDVYQHERDVDRAVRGHNLFEALIIYNGQKIKIGTILEMTVDCIRVQHINHGLLNC